MGHRGGKLPPRCPHHIFNINRQLIHGHHQQNNALTHFHHQIQPPQWDPVQISQNSGTLTQSTSDLQRSTSISSSGKPTIISTSKSPIVLQGSLKKLKTMKKKYFVLYRDDFKDNTVARLEYYDSEKKFRARGAQPKRKIILKSATITRRLDTKHKFVIAFQTKEEPFSIVLETEKDLNKWLQACLALQRGEQILEDPPKPAFGEYILGFNVLFFFQIDNIIYIY